MFHVSSGLGEFKNCTVCDLERIPFSTALGAFGTAGGNEGPFVGSPLSGFAGPIFSSHSSSSLLLLLLSSLSSLSSLYTFFFMDDGELRADMLLLRGPFSPAAPMRSRSARNLSCLTLSSSSSSSLLLFASGLPAGSCGSGPGPG